MYALISGIFRLDGKLIIDLITLIAGSCNKLFSDKMSAFALWNRDLLNSASVILRRKEKLLILIVMDIGHKRFIPKGGSEE